MEENNHSVPYMGVVKSMAELSEGKRWVVVGDSWGDPFFCTRDAFVSYITPLITKGPNPTPEPGSSAQVLFKSKRNVSCPVGALRN